MITSLCVLCAQTALVAAAPIASNPQPFQLPRVPNAYQQSISHRSLIYGIEMGGTLDEFNTASYPNTRLGYTRLESLFQPNTFLMMENTGLENVVNPRIVVNERRDWYSADSILDSIFEPDMSDAERAMAIFYHTADLEVQTHDNNSRVGPEFPHEYNNPSAGTFKELANPVKASNSYYSNGCSTVASNYVVLARQAGFEARVVWLSPEDRYRTHSVAEVFYDGSWHVFDPDSRAFYLDANNKTVASYETLHNNPSLFDRAHLGGFASTGIEKEFGKEYAKFFPPRQMPVEDDWVSTMGMTLRPGEKFIWRWDHDNEFRWGNNPRNKAFLPSQLANGKMVFTPHLDDTIRGRDVISEDNVRSVFGAANGKITVQPEIAGTPASLIYQISSPYPVVGGLIGGTFFRSTVQDEVDLYVSKDGEDWTQVWRADRIGGLEDYVSIDEALNAGPSEPIYDYLVRVELFGNARTSGAQLRQLYIETDVQMAESSLPSLSVGNNTIHYRDESGSDRLVRITHGWEESTATTPPTPPSPANQVNSSGAKILQWNKAVDPDGESIVDYRIQVSSRPDMLFPVSSNFDRILFSDETQWAIPDGWLKPAADYFWRVRAKDEWGAWSDWSNVATFSTANLAPRLVTVPEPASAVTLLLAIPLFGCGALVRRRLCNTRWTLAMVQAEER